MKVLNGIDKEEINISPFASEKENRNEAGEDMEFILREINVMNGGKISDETIDREGISINFIGAAPEIVSDEYCEGDYYEVQARYWRLYESIMEAIMAKIRAGLKSYKRKLISGFEKEEYLKWKQIFEGEREIDYEEVNKRYLSSYIESESRAKQIIDKAISNGYLVQNSKMKLEVNMPAVSKYLQPEEGK